MKKLMLGLAATALIFASCSKDETTGTNGNNPNVIGFETSTGKTKALTANLTTLQGDANGFGVYATNGATPAEFINNAAYKYDGSAWKWAATNIMWPTTDAGYPINFYAYYPKASATLTSALTASYTVAATAATQVDYLAAKQTGVVARPTSSTVAMDFKHILSKIDFKVITGAAVTVEVQSITVKNVGNNGTFSFANLAWSAAPTAWAQQYAYVSAPVAAANKFAGAAAPGASVTGASGSLMLMPQDLSARAWDKTAATLGTGSYIEVVYRVYETVGGKDVVGYGKASDHPNYVGSQAETDGYDGALFVTVGYPLPTNWEMGKGYTYTIYLGTADASGGNLTEDNFIDDDGDDTDLPVVDSGTEEPKIIPDPIVDTNKPIGFTVSVTAWDDQTANPLQ